MEQNRSRVTSRVTNHYSNAGILFQHSRSRAPETEVCAEYLALLTQMVDQYKADTHRG